MAICAGPAVAQPSFGEGRWVTVTAAQERQAFAALPVFEAAGIERARTRSERWAIPWAPRAHLYRFRDGWAPDALVFYALRMPDGDFVQLTGDVAPILALATEVELSLLGWEADDLADYLRFFTFFLRDANGAYVIVERARDPLLPRGLEAGDVAGAVGDLGNVFRPVTCRADAPSNGFSCNAILYYAQAIYEAEFLLALDGAVRLARFRALASDLSASPEVPITREAVGEAFEAEVTPPPPPPVASTTTTSTTARSGTRAAGSAGSAAGGRSAHDDAALAELRGTVPGEVMGTLEALMEGRPVRLNRENTPFLAGMAGAMMERCGLPRSMAVRTRLAGFVTASSIGASVGFDYSNPDLRAAIGSQVRQQSLWAAGAFAVQNMGCNAGMNTLGERIAEVVQGNSASGSGFVASCRSAHGERSCTCLANLGRQVIPDIAQRSYSPRIIREIINRNPFLGLAIGVSCGISNY